PSLTMRGNDVVTPNGPAFTARIRGFANALVSDNDLTGASVDSNVVIEYGEGSVQLDSNHIVSTPAQARDVIHVAAKHVTFTGNHCTCPRAAGPQFHVHLLADSATATGNHVLESAVAPGKIVVAPVRPRRPTGRGGQ